MKRSSLNRARARSSAASPCRSRRRRVGPQRRACGRRARPASPRGTQRSSPTTSGSAPARDRHNRHARAHRLERRVAERLVPTRRHDEPSPRRPAAGRSSSLARRAPRSSTGAPRAPRRRAQRSAERPVAGDPQRHARSRGGLDRDARTPSPARARPSRERVRARAGARARAASALVRAGSAGARSIRSAGHARAARAARAAQRSARRSDRRASRTARLVRASATA